MPSNDDVKKAIDAIWRIESAKLIAALARIVRDVGVAEDLAQAALITALEKWPAQGIPDKPGAWLMQTAKHKAIDVVRRKSMLQRKHEELGRAVDAGDDREHFDIVDHVDDDVGDDLLKLVLTACHPVLSPEARVTLTLRMVGGLTTEEIARAFLTTTTTIQQRVVRAKKTLADEQVQFEVPRADELEERVASVLEVIYFIFNEGYSATAGDDWMRPALCEDALRIGRIMAGLVPDDPEVHGLVALLEIQASRSSARTGPSGEPILLLEQNRALWNRVLIQRGLTSLARALELRPEMGPYTLQAAIAACHATATQASLTPWSRIAGLYDLLAQLMPSPVVELNRAVAHSMAFGPAAGLALVDAIASEPALREYHLLPSVRADFLVKLGRVDEARAELQRAAALAKNAKERELLLQRAASLVTTAES